jgi:hypothetical protein
VSIAPDAAVLNSPASKVKLMSLFQIGLEATAAAAAQAYVACIFLGT